METLTLNTIDLCNLTLSSEGSKVLITLIICVTILWLAYIIKAMIRKDTNQSVEMPPSCVEQKTNITQDLQREEDLKTRKAYQERLISFMEKRAIKKETTIRDEKKTEITRDFDKDRAEEFIKKMDDLIKDLTPTQASPK